jgi:hypothetical protein
MIIVWLPIVKEVASTDSRAPLDEHAAIAAEVTPVTESDAPAVKREVSVLFDPALAPIETKIELPLAGANTNPSMAPPAA